MVRVLAEVCVVVGALLLLAALVPINEVIAQVPQSGIRHRWRTLQAVLLLFLIGYSTYLVVFWERHTEPLDMLVPGILLLGGGAMLMAIRLSTETVAELRTAVRPEREVVIDSLVGIYNRRYIEHRLAEEVARAKRHGLDLSVLVFDLDHFRQLNDHWGRVVGDRVLNYLGRHLLGAVRESDVVARFGGEELIVIAPNTALTHALELADRLRKGVELENLGFGGEAGDTPELQVTVSVGVAQLDPAADEWATLVRRAEEAVTRAKRAGRNRVAS